MLGVGHEPELEPAQLEIELFFEVRISCTVTGYIWMICSGYRDGLSRSAFIIAKMDVIFDGVAILYI
jgi:hypothetical protein